MNNESDDSSKRVSKSNYFQTEFTLSISKRGEEQGISRDEEYVSAYDKSNIDISVQADEDIIYESKKTWVRPPLVGQASLPDSDDEIIEPTLTDELPNRKDYVSEKPPEGASLEQPAVSPSSSLISVKPLEWDSGADVGYYERENVQMSSIERMAIEEANGSLLKRSDPEGTPNVVQKNLGTPEAESTRVSSETSQNTNRYPLFPEIIVNQFDCSDSEAEAHEEKIAEKKEGSATFPRTQSELHPRIKQLAVNKSNSSSSVATVVKNRSSQSHESKQSETDSANSFEYLPGDTYERSTSPDLKKDIERGVKILGQFMENSKANDTISKKLLLKKIIEDLLDKKYPGDEEYEVAVLTKDRCMSRRCQNRDDVSGQSLDENSHDSVLSRMGKKAAEGHSSSSYKNSTTQSSGSYSIPKAEGQIPVPPPIPDLKRNPKTESDRKTSESPNWKIPVTKAEKIYEIQKAKDKLDPKLLQFLTSERENQLKWIKKEINHLNNLKTLLEKHETIKRNFAHLKRVKERKTKQLEHRNTKNYKPQTRNLPRKTPFKEDSSDQTQSSWQSHGYSGKTHGLKRNASTNTGMSIMTEMPKIPSKSVAYTIVFQENKPVQQDHAYRSSNTKRIIIADREELKRDSAEKIKTQLSNLKLQDELIKNKPDYIMRAENRRQVVSEIAAIREIRQNNKEKILAAAINGEHSEIAPNPLAIKRVVSQKVMRKTTENKYKQTDEIKRKQIENKRIQDYKTNRLMADIFTKKLQKKVLHGQTDLSNSVNVISTY